MHIIYTQGPPVRAASAAHCLRGAGVIFFAPKPRARGALGGSGTSEIAIAVLKLCPGDPCVRARHAAAATCAKTQQQRLRRRPPRAPRFLHVLGALVGLGAGFGGPWSRRTPPGGGSFVGAEVERRHPKPRRALRGFWLHPVHFFCACRRRAPGPATRAWLELPQHTPVGVSPTATASS